MAASASEIRGPSSKLFLPDFCESRAVLAVVLIVELVAMMFAISRQALHDKSAPLALQARATAQRALGSRNSFAGFIEDGSFVRWRELAVTWTPARCSCCGSVSFVQPCSAAHATGCTRCPQHAHR